MAESSTTSPETVPELDLLVTTKFHVPRAGFVPRPRLLARLAQGMERGLTLVRTPAGFGKTTLLCDWPAAAIAPPRGCRWMWHNDPARFGGTSPRRLTVCGQGSATGRPAAPRPASATVGNGGDHGDQRHGFRARAGHARLGRLPHDRGLAGARERRFPARTAAARAALGAREPRRPAVAAGAFARPRPARRAARDRAALLFWTRRLPSCGRRLGSIFPTASIRRSAESVPRAGWPGCSWPRCRCRDYIPIRPGSSLRSRAATATSLNDLTEEGLSTTARAGRALPAGDVGAGEVSGPLCDAVTERAEGQRGSRLLERANLFVVPLDQGARWWRYHHLFADLLRVRLAERAARAGTGAAPCGSRLA